MYYKVSELRGNLIEKVNGLGIDSKFKKNPAYASAILGIDSLIAQMNMQEAEDSVTVQEEQGRISFSWTSPAGEKYSMIISCSNPETFSCIRMEEKKPLVGINGQIIREKNVIEQVATIDKSDFVTLTTNASMIDNMDCSANKCNNVTWAEKKYYTANGVMKEKEYKEFEGELSENFDRASVASMLHIPREAFDFKYWHDKYERRTLLTRDKLDTARIVSEDKTKGIRYSAITPLKQEGGLRDMNLPGGNDPYPQDVVIYPLSKEEIEAMIKRENNPKVAEGLREYAIGRENYYYSSSEDKDFVSEGISQSQGISK